MSGRICLLTFDQLPFLPRLTANGSESLIAQTIAEFSAGATLFENHYLQSQGVSGLLEQFTAADFLSAERPISTNTRFVTSAAQPTLPDWLNASWHDASKHDASVVAPTSLPAEEELTGLRAADFSWLHFGAAVDDQLCEFLRSALALGETFLTSPDDLLLVTSLNGSRLPDTPEFASEFCESQARVPLWLKRLKIPGRRVQRIVGSHDIPFTIRQFLCSASPADSESSEKSTRDDPHSLLTISAEAQRVLRIHHGDVTGLRTNEFFFVQNSRPKTADVHGFSENRAALYAKPEDVWNVNDVSAEYLDIAESLQKLI